MALSEKEVGEAFKVELERQPFILEDKGHNKEPYKTQFKVYLNKPIRTHTEKFKRFWQKKNLNIMDIPPPQPEIDMILVDDFDIMRAVEIKVIKETKKGVRPSYYIGLGQALAYLSFGFHQVALWLCFDGNSLSNGKIYEYNDAFTRIRAPVANLLDVTYFKVVGEKGALHFETGSYNQYSKKRWWEPGIGLPQEKSNKLGWTSLNPFFNPFYLSDEKPRIFQREVTKRVKAIYEYLEEQRKKIWDKNS